MKESSIDQDTPRRIPPSAMSALALLKTGRHPITGALRNKGKTSSGYIKQKTKRIAEETMAGLFQKK